MEHQFKPWQPVIVRNHDDEEWKPTFYAWQCKNDELHYTLGLGWRRQVLPAKGNRHLIGTTDSPTPPEPEFKFGDKVKVRDVDGKWLNAIFIQKKQDGNGEYYEVRFVNDILGYFGKYHIRHADW